MIVASLAHANERVVHVHNVRRFLLARLNSKINAHFLSNENGDLYFLLHNNSVHVILLYRKFYRKDKRGESVHKILTLGCKL